MTNLGEVCEVCFKEITHHEVIEAEDIYQCGGPMCRQCATSFLDGAILDEEDRAWEEMQ